MKCSISACLVAASLMLACPGSGDDGDEATSQTSMTEVGILTRTPTTGEDSAETSADSTTGGDAETSGSDSSTTFEGCFLENIEAEVTIPRVMLVLDKSGSMVADGDGYWDADADPNTPPITRWQSLHETVQFIVGGFEERMDFGAVLFPAIDAKGVYNAAACPVNANPDVAIGTDMGATILATIPPAGSLELAGGTPAAAGMLTGIAGLATDDPMEDERPKYIILVTDGAANCPLEPADATPASLFERYDDQLPVVVGDALAAKIPTFVVGIDIDDVTSNADQDGNPDDTNTYTRLNEVAMSGGKARDGAEKFYNTANQVELQEALMKISELITECTFDLSKPLEDLPYVYVESLSVDPGGVDLQYGKGQVTDCDSESGWHFTDATKGHIELCGDACTLFKQTGEVDIVFQCEAP